MPSLHIFHKLGVNEEKDELMDTKVRKSGLILIEKRNFIFQMPEINKVDLAPLLKHSPQQLEATSTVGVGCFLSYGFTHFHRTHAQ